MTRKLVKFIVKFKFSHRLADVSQTLLPKKIPSMIDTSEQREDTCKFVWNLCVGVIATIVLYQKEPCRSSLHCFLLIFVDAARYTGWDIMRECQIKWRECQKNPQGWKDFPFLSEILSHPLRKTVPYSPTTHWTRCLARFQKREWKISANWKARMFSLQPTMYGKFSSSCNDFKSLSFPPRLSRNSINKNCK